MDRKNFLSIDSETFFSILKGEDKKYFIKVPDRFFEECIVLENLEIIDLVYNSSEDKPIIVGFPIIFKNVVFKNDVYFQNIIFNNSLTVESAHFESNFNIGNGTKIEKLLLKGGIYEGYVKMSDGEINVFNLQGFPEFKKPIKIVGGIVKTLTINCNSILQIELQNSEEFLFKTNPKVKKVLFQNFFNKESTFIYNCSNNLENLAFEGFVNEGKMLFKNSSKFQFKENKKQVFSTSKSILGNITFINFGLSRFNLQFEDSNFELIKFESDNFPNIDDIRTQKNNKNENHYENLLLQLKKFYTNKGDFYRAFKTEEELLLFQINKFELDNKEDLKNIYSRMRVLYEQNGDSIKALEYKAKELSTYRKILKREKGKFGEKVNLCLNHYSSYYGNYWGQALLITLVLTFLLFSIYCFCAGFKFGRDYKLFCNLVSHSFEFLNPIRKVDTLKDKHPNIEISSTMRILDYLSRVVISYFAYQTYQASRKFGKKTT